MNITTSATVIATLALGACTPTEPKTDTGAIEKQLQVNEAKWNRAYAAHDAEALAGMYADDAALANPGEQLVRGKEAIRQATNDFAADPNLKVAFRANRIQVARSGDIGYARGRFTMTMTNPGTNRPETSTGHYLTVWQKQSDGSWKVVEDMITPGPPPAVAQGPTVIL